MSADNVKLVELIKDRPPIYNCHLKDHGDRKVIERLWSEVALEMKWEVEECKKQWGIFRNSYARCLRLTNEPTVCEKKRKVWYLFEPMNFLQEFMNINKIKRTRPPKSKNHSESPDYSKIQKTDDSDIDAVVLEIKSESPDIAETVKELLGRNVDSTHPPIFKEQRQQVMCNNSGTEQVEGDHILELSLPQNMKKELDEFEDPNMLFFKSLLPDLEKLSEQRQRLFRRRTFLCLHNLIDEEENLSQTAHQ